MEWRYAAVEDVALLAELNRELIRDEGHANPMGIRELETRMRSWLSCGYRAVLFESGSTVVGYALFRPADLDLYLRQFFIGRPHRRRGLGRRALGLLRDRVWPPGSPVTVEVLAHNEGGLAFWRSVGFSDYSVTLKWHPEGAPDR